MGRSFLLLSITIVVAICSLQGQVLKGIDSVKNQFSIPAIDSILTSDIKHDFKAIKDARPRIEIQGLQLKSLLQFQDGFIGYTLNYRSVIDTPFAENNFSQHFISANANFLLAQKLPIRFQYFGRQSSSKIFRDFNDFRIELNASELERIRNNKISTQVRNYAAEKMNTSMVQQKMNVVKNKSLDLDYWLNASETVNKLLSSREQLVAKEFIDRDKKDSIVKNAEEFIWYYDKVKEGRERLQATYDSLQETYTGLLKDAQAFQRLLEGNIGELNTNRELKKLMDKYGRDEDVDKMLKQASSIRKIALGKSIPDYSDLTLKNVSVNGINLEYNSGNLYTAITAGTVSYRIRDFVRSAPRMAQYVYAARIGYGVKEKNNIILTYFEGKKQLSQVSYKNGPAKINGLSIASQFFRAPYLKINVEIAQAASTHNLYNDSAKHSLFSFKDRNSQAWSIALRSQIPVTRTRLEGRYQYTGVNYQNFTTYKVNATNNRWYARLDQSLFKRQMQLSAMVQKNNFDNPYLLERYNANTIYKSFSASFRKRKWPSLTIGYIPSSQLAMIDNEVYETHYQIINLAAHHQYKLGETNASSSVLFNHFYNDRQDSGFIFYNTSSYVANQVFYFPSYSAFLNLSHSDNGRYKFNLMDAGFNIPVWRNQQSGFGTKVNQMQNREVKVGFYTTLNLTFQKLGNLNARIEKSYLPGWNQQLIKSEFYTVGFTRYLK